MAQEQDMNQQVRLLNLILEMELKQVVLVLMVSMADSRQLMLQEKHTTHLKHSQLVQSSSTMNLKQLGFQRQPQVMLNPFLLPM